MQVDQHYCPLCNSTLQLKQINLNAAVYICMELACPYPVNRDDCILVKRRLRDIKKPISALKKDFELKHNIKKEVMTTGLIQPSESIRSVESLVSNSPSMVSDTDLFPMQEIDDLLNSIDTFNQNKDTKPKKETEDFNSTTFESLIWDNSTGDSKPIRTTKIKNETEPSLGDELQILPISESQYQDMDNFLMDLLD